MPDVTNAFATPGWGCPIAIYKTVLGGTLLTWNKITVYFSIPSFPTSSSNAVYKLTMSLGGTDNNSPTIAWPSLASNLPTYPSGARLSCSLNGNSKT